MKTKLQRYFARLGKRGGIARTKAMSPGQRKISAKRAATARWKNGGRNNLTNGNESGS